MMMMMMVVVVVAVVVVMEPLDPEIYIRCCPNGGAG
jgi:hypothetical protein